MAASVQSLVEPAPPRKRLIQVTALAWFAIIGLDLLLNACLFAPFYQWEQPGFLPPLKMFRYIPLGYAAFLLSRIALVWLIVRTHSYGAGPGAAFGAKLGVLFGGAAFLGWLSLFALPKVMLFCWALDHMLVFILACAVIGAGLRAERLRPLVLRVVALFLLCLVATIVPQSLGLVPAKTAHGRVGIGWDPDK
jgi:hypothetical protein